MSSPASGNGQLFRVLLAQLTPAERLARALDAAELARRLVWLGLEQRFPEANAEELAHQMQQLSTRCPSRNC